MPEPTIEDVNRMTNWMWSKCGPADSYKDDSKDALIAKCVEVLFRYSESRWADTTPAMSAIAAWIDGESDYHPQSRSGMRLEAVCWGFYYSHTRYLKSLGLDG